MLLALAIRSTLLLVLAFAVNLSLRRASAAIRHLVWTAVFTCLLALPLLQRSAPRWNVAVPAAAPQVVAAVMSDEAPPLPQPVAPRRAIDYSLFWSVGVFLAAVRLLAGLIRLRKLRSGASRAPWNTLPRATPAILESDQIDLPITFGILRPTIVFPRNATAWPPERLRLVLAHELAHVRRLDCLTQLLAEAMCALYCSIPSPG